MAYKLAEEDKLCGVIYPTYEGFSPIPKATCEMLESKCEQTIIVKCGESSKEDKKPESQSGSASASASESTSESTSTTESTTTSESTSVSTSESASSSTENSNTPEEPKPTPEVTELSDEDIRREVNVQRYFGSATIDGDKISSIYEEIGGLSLEETIELYDRGIIRDLDEKLNKNRPDGSKYKVTAKTTQIKHSGDQESYSNFASDIFETVIKVTKPNGEVLELINNPQTSLIETL